MNDTKKVSHEYIQREIKKNLCRYKKYAIIISDYFSWHEKSFFKFDKLLAGMVTKVHPQCIMYAEKLALILSVQISEKCMSP